MGSPALFGNEFNINNENWYNYIYGNDIITKLLFWLKHVNPIYLKPKKRRWWKFSIKDHNFDKYIKELT